MPFPFNDLSGKVFCRLTVRWPAGRIRKRNGSVMVWLCSCECGNLVVTRAGSLRRGQKKSCGCLQRETKELGFIHGHCRDEGSTREYRSWTAMRARCTNPNDRGWLNYGGRGITICERWLGNFPNFLADMGRRPIGKTLDRIDNDGNYEPGNCRWATAYQQTHNRRSRAETLAARQRQAVNA